MKKKFSILALLSLLLMAVVPSGTALAAKPVPFGAGGTIDSITPGDVDAAGASGRFVVKERSVSGLLLFGSPDLLGPYTLTFGTNVPLLTQSGQIHGTLTVGDYEAKVRASSEIGLTPVPCAPGSPGCVPVAPSAGFYPGLLISGTLTFTEGTQGHGELSGWLIPAIDPLTGHIVDVIAGAVSVSG